MCENTDAIMPRTYGNFTPRRRNGRLFCDGIMLTTPTSFPLPLPPYPSIGWRRACLEKHYMCKAKACLYSLKRYSIIFLICGSLSIFYIHLHERNLTVRIYEIMESLM